MPDSNPKYEKVPRPASVAKLIEILESRFFNVTQEDDQHLTVERPDQSTMIVHMTNIYIFDVASYEEAKSSRPDITVCVSMSNWNHYTNEVKEYAKEQNVGIFTFKELLGAVNYEGQPFIDYEAPEAH